MKVEITVQGRAYECCRFTASGDTAAAIKAELDALVHDVQAASWDAYEALVALRDGREGDKPSAPNPLPTAEELIKSELGGKVIDVVDSTSSETSPFWERKSAPEPTAMPPLTAAPAVMPSFF